MSRLSIPSSPKISLLNISSFRGADFTNAPGTSSPSRSPDCQNVIRESSGKIRKWIGFHTIKTFANMKINGFHTFKNEDGEKLLIHAGTNLYYGDTLLYSSMNDERSVSKQLNGKLIIADGLKLLMYGKFTVDNADVYEVRTVESEAYIPTIVIARTPTGGGQTYEPINLLGTKRIDSFAGTASATAYQLSATGITAIEKIEKLNAQGGKDEVSAYTVDLTTGTVTFTTAPGISPKEGEDNVFITYSKSVDGYSDKINTCDIMTLYGVSGSRDRIFLAGDDKYPNRDYYCQMDNPTYWGDLWYLIVGQDNSKIMGYSIINDKLATHLDRSDDNTNIILRTGNLTTDGEASFTLAGGYQGSGAISKYAFTNLETEPLFMTEDGIMAVTPSDVLGERYAQLRSYYINGKLLKQDLQNAVAVTFDRFYMVSCGGLLFALDGTQADTEKNMPYSSRQYEGFLRTNVNARCICVTDNKLTFGTVDGKVCQFYDDYSNLNYFNDDNAFIHAKWITPEIAGDNFYYKKRFKLISLMIGSAVSTSVKISAAYDGIVESLMEYNSQARYFSYSGLQYSKFTYKTDKTAQIIREKISIKPDNRKVQFIFENNILNEPLSLYEATIEFTESR